MSLATVLTLRFEAYAATPCRFASLNLCCAVPLSLLDATPTDLSTGGLMAPRRLNSSPMLGARRCPRGLREIFQLLSDAVTMNSLTSRLATLVGHCVMCALQRLAVTAMSRSRVTLLLRMLAYNQPIHVWDFSSVTTMSHMFLAMIEFTHPIYLLKVRDGQTQGLRLTLIISNQQ